MKDKVDFLHAEVHEGFLLINTILIGMVKHSKSSRNSRFAMSLQYLKKEVRDEVYFLYQSINLKVDFNNLGVKISYKAILSLLIGMIKHSQSTQSNKFTIFLQYREEFIFCMQMNIKKFLKVSIVILDGSRQICPKYSKKKVGNIFAIYYEKSIGTALVLYFDAKY